MRPTVSVPLDSPSTQPAHPQPVHSTGQLHAMSATGGAIAKAFLDEYKKTPARVKVRIEGELARGTVSLPDWGQRPMTQVPSLKRR